MLQNVMFVFDAYLILALMDKNPIFQISFSKMLDIFKNNEYLIKVTRINDDSENACGFSDVMFRDFTWKKYLVTRK